MTEDTRAKSLIAILRMAHRPVQWKGWRLWLMVLKRDPRADVKVWCKEDGQPWPCGTEKSLREFEQAHNL